jgi:hypothetical protein
MARPDDSASRDLTNHAQVVGVRDIDYYDAAIAEHVCVVAGDRSANRAVEHAIGIEAGSAMEEVVVGVSVTERAYVDRDQTLVTIGNERVGRLQRDLLFPVVGSLTAGRVDEQGGRQEHRRGIPGRHVGSLPERRNRRGREAFREILVVEVRDVVNHKAALALRGEEILAAILNRSYLGMKLGQVALPSDLEIRGVLERVVQDAPTLDEFLELVGVGQFVQAASDDRLRFVTLGYHHRFQSLVAFRHPAVSADEIHQVGALHQELREPGVVVVILGDVAIAAVLGLGPAHRVRHGGAEGLSGKPFRGNGLLLRVDDGALGIVRAHQDRA